MLDKQLHLHFSSSSTNQKFNYVTVYIYSSTGKASFY